VELGDRFFECHLAIGRFAVEARAARLYDVLDLFIRDVGELTVEWEVFGRCSSLLDLADPVL
jgi:hypothetical protein